MSEPLAVEMKGITKRFPGVVANDQVEFSLRRGEVHALLGENGAGKTTLMNILTGLYLPDEGQITIQGQPAEFNSPRDAIDRGIGMVHQHFMLARIFTVAENIIAGLDEPRFWLNMKQVFEEIKAFGEKHRLEVNPAAKIWQLSVGEQQRVEILKSLYRGAEILILDEPTSVLTVQEAEELFTALRSMTAEGKSIIFISHKLDEVFAIADRVTVLRGGKLVGTVNTADSDKVDLARMMVGREMEFTLDREPMEPGETVLSLQGVHTNGTGRNSAVPARCACPERLRHHGAQRPFSGCAPE
jgi:simple sugar transport system ATP-binding protein